MKQVNKVKKTIEVHHGALLANQRVWRCICGEDLGLPEQNGLNGPTQQQIVGKWAAHVAERVVAIR